MTEKCVQQFWNRYAFGVTQRLGALHTITFETSIQQTFEYKRSASNQITNPLNRWRLWVTCLSTPCGLMRFYVFHICQTLVRLVPTFNQIPLYLSQSLRIPSLSRWNFSAAEKNYKLLLFMNSHEKNEKIWFVRELWAFEVWVKTVQKCVSNASIRMKVR